MLRIFEISDLAQYDPNRVNWAVKQTNPLKTNGHFHKFDTVKSECYIYYAKYIQQTFRFCFRICRLNILRKIKFCMIDQYLRHLNPQ